MTVQIAVRLPDDIVEFVDELVTAGKASSRAAVVTHALEAERRRASAERDAQIYLAAKTPDGLDDLAVWAHTHPLDID
jgi:Arc/MetJ-type ribon-helix-helix transcriptional regulator